MHLYPGGKIEPELQKRRAVIRQRSGRLLRSGTMVEVKGDDSLEEVFLELEEETC